MRNNYVVPHFSFASFVITDFYPLDDMLERVIAVATCLSGCLAGCPSQPVLYQNGNS